VGKNNNNKKKTQKSNENGRGFGPIQDSSEYRQSAELYPGHADTS
jgi:hypothetical protein